MENFTPVASLVGGLLIGLSATLYLLFNGRIAGISGILWQSVAGGPSEDAWTARAFLGGLLASGLAMYVAYPAMFAVTYERSPLVLVAAGLLVGYGVRAGGGCTSGHGVCGLSRRSRRSLTATLTFMFTGAATVFLVGLLGGAS